MQKSARPVVTTVPQSVVSPAFKSAPRETSARLRIWRSAMPQTWKSVLLACALALATATVAQCAEPAARIEFKRDDAKGQLRILIGGKEALVYCYGNDVDLPHFYPVRSPSGKSMTVEQTEPYPHHRSFWFADTVQLAGQRQVSFYNAFYSGTGDKQNPKPPFLDHIQRLAFTAQRGGNKDAELDLKLLW